MRKLAVVGGLVAALALVTGVVAVATSPKILAPIRIHVIEHATTDVVIDTDQSGTDTTGDLLTFANKVYDATNTDVVGRDQGDCIRIVPGKSWECRWITWLGRGAITVEGPFFDTRDSVLAITGGTGVFRNARGVMVLHALSATEFDFVFLIEP